MKLLYVLGSFYPAQNGGPNNTTFWAAREMARRGGEIAVASLKDGLTEEHIDHHGLSLGCENRIDGIGVWYFDYRFSRYLSLSMFLWLQRNIKHYDMVNLTSVFFPWTWIVAVLCILHRVPFSIAPRGELEPGAYCYGKRQKNLIQRLFLRRLMARARFVLVTSDQEECYSRPYFPKEMCFEIVPNYTEIGEKAPVFEAIQKKRDILYLGRIHPKKGIENLINAFNLLNTETLGGHRLLVVGTGNKAYVDGLKMMAEESRRGDAIQFLGHCVGEEKSQIYEDSRVLVLPSYSENFGNVVVEALAHSTPVIASRLTPWKSLEEAECGCWTDNDPESLAKALESILSLEQEDYIAMAQAARRFVIEYYDIRKNGGRLERLYQGYLS